MAKRKLSPVAIAGLLSAVAAVITALVALLNVWTRDSGVAIVKVPDVIGIPVRAAQTTLENNRLIPGNVEYRSDAEKDPETVLQQFPRPDLEVAENTVVQLIAVEKLETVIVPDMVDLPLQVAKTTLDNNALKMGELKSKRASGRSGIVLSHTPKADEEVPKNTAVDFVLPAVEAKVVVPNIVGMPLDTARNILTHTRLKLGDIEEKKTGRFAPNTIVSQSPLSGAFVPPGTTISTQVAIHIDPNLIAYYKFDGTPKDFSGISPSFSLQNTKFVDKTLYLNGRYRHGAGGGYLAVGKINDFRYSQFTVALDFFALTFGGPRNVILMGGTSYRWFGLHWNNGNLQLTLNNMDYKHTFRDGQLNKGRWHNIICSVDLDKRSVLAALDGRVLRRVALPADFKLRILGSAAENRDNSLTFTNYGNASVFHGYVANLRVYNKSSSVSDIREFYQRIKGDAPKTRP